MLTNCKYASFNKKRKYQTWMHYLLGLFLAGNIYPPPFEVDELLPVEPLGPARLLLLPAAHVTVEGAVEAALVEAPQSWLEEGLFLRKSYGLWCTTAAPRMKNELYGIKLQSVERI